MKTYELENFMQSFSGTEKELEEKLGKLLDSGEVTLGMVESAMPLWEGYINSCDPSFVVRYEIAKEREKGDEQAFCC